ncbi:MAG TPA: outer membrane beta-barrel protein [Longimicrobiales bacterium]|nr:outer membrane beta-barrel protein [Longimicrobiales bacterium]
MRRSLFAAAVVGGLLALQAVPAAAQVYITPSIGVFIPASDLEDLEGQAEQTRFDRSGTLGLGLNIELGWLRGSVAYATGATISDDGVSGEDEIGDGSVLAAAADLVIRPLPRLFVQPYLLGGLGLKRQDFSYDDEGVSTNPLPSDKTDLAVHAGVGADLMFGRFGIMAEVTDYITRNDDNSFGQHDAFAMVGLRVRM